MKPKDLLLASIHMAPHKKCGVYLIFNIFSEKGYIGISKNIGRRWSDHKIKLKTNRHKNGKLQNAFNKYGEGSFVYCVLTTCIQEQLKSEEERFLKLFKEEDIYNLRSAEYYESLSSSSKQKMSDAKKGKKLSEEHKKRISEGLKGRIVYADTRLKLSESNKGKHSRFGFKLSEEHKRKISEGHKRRAFKY